MTFTIEGMRDTEVPASVVPEVQAWLEEHWDPDLLVREWWQVVAAAGWSKPQFPVAVGGRGLPPKAESVVRATFRAHGALPPPGGLGHLMAAPTIVTEGSAEQIAAHVPPILEGRVGWCQLFSEPGNGSDLAAVTTRAVRDGDCYVVNGQKVWTSQAMEADFGMLLARTDPDVPKHAGMSWFVLPLNQPGVTVRPLREMTGRSYFNEVFFDDAVCPAANRVGDEGAGWRIAQTTLMFERSGIGPNGTFSMLPHPGPKAGNLDRRAGDAVGDEPPAFIRLAVEDVIALAREYGRAADPVVRQSLARLVCYRSTAIWNGKRATAGADRRATSGLASLGKIAGSRTTLATVRLACQIVGPAAALAGPAAPMAGDVAESTLASAAARIGGGTDEIQRNVIAERVLGLPREPRPDTEVPFRDLPKNTTTRPSSREAPR